MRIPFIGQREVPPAPEASGPAPRVRQITEAVRQMVRLQQRSMASSRDADNEVAVQDIFNELHDTSFFGTGSRWQRGAVWRAQTMYELEGYTFEIVNAIVGFAVGSSRLIDFGDEELNDDFYSWRWNPLSRTDTPIQLAHQLGVFLLRDGDIFEEQIAPPDLSRVRLFSLDARFIWSNAGGYQAHESLGVKLNDQLEPVAYVYQPLAMQPYEIQPREYREIPADTVIHVFKTEFPGQTRGFPWIRRALPFLRILEDFDRMAFRAMHRMITNPGYWSYPVEYMLQDTDTEAPDLDDPDQEAMIRAVYKQILEETRWEDVDVEPRMPTGIEWHEKTHSGLPEHIVKAIRGLLLERVARSVGLSPLALSASGDGTGFLLARVATQGDQKFYSEVQEYIRAALTAVVEYFLDWAMNKSLLWQTRYRGKYQIAFPAFAYIDPLKDAAGVQIQLDSSVLSPQQAIRDSGHDPARVAAEILEWRERLGEHKPREQTDRVSQLLDEATTEQS